MSVRNRAQRQGGGQLHEKTGTCEYQQCHTPEARTWQKRHQPQYPYTPIAQRALRRTGDPSLGMHPPGNTPKTPTKDT